MVVQAVKVSSGTMWNLRIICALCACCTLLLSALLYILTIFVIFMLYFTLMYNMQYNIIVHDLAQLHRNHAFLLLIRSYRYTYAAHMRVCVYVVVITIIIYC